MLLILASPHVLSEPSGAGARPVHPIRVQSRRCKNCLVAVGGYNGHRDAPEPEGSVAIDPKRTFAQIYPSSDRFWHAVG